MKPLLLKYYTFFPLLLLCIFYILKAINFPIHDFSNYYFGGKFLVEGNFNEAIYFPYEFNKQILDLGYTEIFASYAPNTPFLALFFAFFSFLTVGIAKLVFNIISSILFIYSINKLFQFYKIDFKFLLLLPILFFVPIKNQILFGQVYFLLFFLLAEFWLAYEKKYLTKASFFLSLAILLKVFPILFVFIFLFQKQFRLLIYTSVICILILGISGLFSGFDIWFFYFEKVLPKASNGEIATAFVDNYQSVFMFLKRLLVFDITENPIVFFNNTILFSGFILGFKIAVVAIGFYISRKISNQLFIYSYWILASILISPYGSTYTFILLFFPFLFLLKSEILSLKKIVFVAILFLINNIPSSQFLSNQFPFSYFRLLILILFYGFFVSFYYNNINWKRVSLFTIIPIVVVLIYNKNEDPNSSYLLNKNAPILIYDYKIKNKKMTYFYWNEKGENSETVSFEYRNLVDLIINKNQVFYKNKQLTFDNSNKLKPILIDGKTLLFLSDFDRGIGFYTLRKIKIN